MMKQCHQSAARLGLAALALAVSLPAPAADAGDAAGWYAAGSIGRAGNHIDHDSVRSGLAFGGITTGGGMTTDSIDDDNRSPGGKLLGGYRFNPSLALEGGYVTLGRLGFTARTTPAGTLTGRLKVRGLAFNVVGTLPLLGDVSGFGRAGLVASRARSNFSQTGAVVVLRPTSSHSGLGYNAGLGLQARLTPALSLRLEGEVFRVHDGVGDRENVRLLSIGLVYRFSGTS